MKRTALILAGAAAFDLGVMVVAAKAQQQAAPAPGLTIRGNEQQTLGTAPSPGPRGAEAGVQVGPGGCVLRPGQTVPGGTGCPGGPAAISDQAAAGNLTSFLPTAQSDDLKIKMLGATYIRVDRVNTIQACRARQGEVVRHQGVQQCRIPAPEVPAVGNPTLPRPGGVPPR